MSKRKAFLAIVKTPLGIWDSTAAVCEGHEPEYRAKQRAKFLFIKDILPPFMKVDLNGLADRYWQCAVANGCEMIVRELDIADDPSPPNKAE